MLLAVIDVQQILTGITGIIVTVFGVVHKLDVRKASRERKKIYLLVNSKMGEALRSRVSLCESVLTLSKRIASLTNNAPADVAAVIAASAAVAEAQVVCHTHDVKQSTVDALNDGKHDK